MELVVLTKPRRLLDVGIGFGKFGFLSREYLDVYSAHTYADWKTRIDGIEVFESYLTPVHRFVYNNVYLGNALEILPKLQTTYDLVLLVDVLEHFDYEDGVKLLDECQRRGRNIIVSTPRDIGSQEDCFGNPFETHRFQWEERHFEQFRGGFLVPNIYSIICYIGEDAQRVRAQRAPRVDELILRFRREFPRFRSSSRLLRVLRLRS